MTEHIYLSKADVTPLEEHYVLRALQSGWVAPLGPDVDAFEAELAERVGVKHALALASGTAALHLALIHLGAGPGTTVIVPSLTFAATANAGAYTGAELFFVDSNPVDGNVDPALLIDAVDMLQNQGKCVAAVITVDLFGRPCDYQAIEANLGQKRIPLIEDAAEALGSTVGPRAAGSFGTGAALSFNGNKIMTTSGGGMLLSDETQLIEHARKLSTQAREPVPWYEHEEIGYNYRLSNISAALGRGQLVRLDEMIARRQEIHDIYRRTLGALDGISFLGESDTRPDVRANNWLTVALLSDDMIVSAHTVIKVLNRNGIEARHVWKPMHLQPIFARNPALVNGTAERIFRQGIALPSGSGLSNREVLRVCEAFWDAVESART